jgi:hypothetical protein
LEQLFFEIYTIGGRNDMILRVFLFDDLNSINYEKIWDKVQIKYRKNLEKKSLSVACL